MKINLTQHLATPEQIAAGVVDLAPEQRQNLVDALTFDSIPSREDLRERAQRIAMFAFGAEAAMIGGAPYLMPHLELALISIGVKPLYAFSAREVVEVIEDDGTVKKTSIFKHIGFVEV